MIKVGTSTVIRRQAGRRVGRIRDFNGLPDSTPLCADLASRKPTARPDRLRSQLSPQGRRPDPRAAATLLGLHYQCSYSILESPMGVDNYVATLKLHAQ